MDHAGEVGRSHLVEGSEEVGGALARLCPGQASDLRPFDDLGLTLSAEALGAMLHSNPRKVPVARPGLLHRDVVDNPLCAGLLDHHAAVEELGKHQCLGRPLLEPAHVDQPGRDDLPRVDARHPRHRQEDPTSTEDLDDQTEDAWLPVLGADGAHDIAHFADLVTVRVVHQQARQAGDEDADGGAAHVRQATAAWP